MDGRTDGRTDEHNIPCILQDNVPLGPLPCLQSEILGKKEKQGKGTADHILTLLDWFMTFGHYCIRPIAPDSSTVYPALFINESVNLITVTDFKNILKKRFTSFVRKI